MRHTLFDIEADGLDPYALSDITLACTLTIDNGERSWGVWGPKATEDLCRRCKAPYRGTGEEMSEYLLRADRVTAHNLTGYDLPVMRHLYGFPSHFENCPQGNDTLVVSQQLFPHLDILDYEESRKGRSTLPQHLFGSHSLKAWGYRLGEHKGDFDGPWDQPTKEMLRYCNQDVIVLEKMHNAFVANPRYVESVVDLEVRFAEYIRLQERNGFTLDRDRVLALVEKLREREAEIIADTRKLVPPKREEMKNPDHWLGTVDGDRRKFRTKKEARKAKATDIERGPNRVKEIPFNPKSRKQIGEYLISRGWKPRKDQLTETGQPQVDEAVLDKLDVKKYPAVDLISEYLMVSKRLGQIADGTNSWLNFRDDVTGRVHGRVKTLGTRTNRCSHVSPNMSQVPSNDKPYGKECRACWTPRPGWTLVGADASGLEARMLAHFCWYYDGGEMNKIILEGDIHTENAKAFFDTDEPTPEQRKAGKPGYYCFLYGGGVGKFASTLKLSKAKAEAVIERYRQQMPQMFKLQDTCKALSEKKGWIPAIDGRKLFAPSQHSALNTLLQGSGSIVVKHATVIFADMVYAEYGPPAIGDTPGVWAPCGHFHDEVQVECEPSVAEPIGQMFCDAMVQAGEQLGCKCPLAGEYKVGSSWAETH